MAADIAPVVAPPALSRPEAFAQAKAAALETARTCGASAKSQQTAHNTALLGPQVELLRCAVSGGGDTGVVVENGGGGDAEVVVVNGGGHSGVVVVNGGGSGVLQSNIG